MPDAAHAGATADSAAPRNAGAPRFDDLANAIRALAMDAVEQAKSGHPGLPMGAADVATVLFSRFLKFDPRQPTWPDRDRFIRTEPAYRKMIVDAVNSDLLASALPMFDWRRTREQTDRWLSQESGGGKFLVSLLTLHGFLARHV